MTWLPYIFISTNKLLFLPKKISNYWELFPKKNPHVKPHQEKDSDFSTI